MSSVSALSLLPKALLNAGICVRGTVGITLRVIFLTAVLLCR